MNHVQLVIVLGGLITDMDIAWFSTKSATLHGGTIAR
jgi:hypothetical protein